VNTLYYRYLVMLSKHSRHPGSFSREGLQYLLRNRYASQKFAASYVEITDAGRMMLQSWLEQNGTLEEKLAGYIE
jgi:hypothetical protein